MLAFADAIVVTDRSFVDPPVWTWNVKTGASSESSSLPWLNTAGIVVVLFTLKEAVVVSGFISKTIARRPSFFSLPLVAARKTTRTVSTMEAKTLIRNKALLESLMGSVSIELNGTTPRTSDGGSELDSRPTSKAENRLGELEAVAGAGKGGRLLGSLDSWRFGTMRADG